MQKAQVCSLGWEHPLDKEVAPHSSRLTWKIPWSEEPGRLHSMGLQKLDTTEHTYTYVTIQWENIFSTPVGFRVPLPNQ